VPSLLRWVRRSALVKASLSVALSGLGRITPGPARKRAIGASGGFPGPFWGFHDHPGGRDTQAPSDGDLRGRTQGVRGAGGKWRLLNKQRAIRERQQCCCGSIALFRALTRRVGSTPTTGPDGWAALPGRASKRLMHCKKCQCRPFVRSRR
jgi:hypothetical protein